MAMLHATSLRYAIRKKSLHTSQFLHCSLHSGVVSSLHTGAPGCRCNLYTVSCTAQGALLINI
jgi:hypothetical protein